MPQEKDPKKNDDTGNIFEKLDAMDLEKFMSEIEHEETESGATQKFTSTGRSGSWEKFELPQDNLPEQESDPSGKTIYEPSHKIKKRRKPKRTGCMGAVLYAVFVIALSCLLATACWIVANDVLALAKSDMEVSVEITEDDTFNDVVNKLKAAGVIEYKTTFKLYAKFAHADEKITPGTYTLNSDYDYYAIVNSMDGSTGIGDTVRLSFPEGFTMDEIFQRLEENGVCSVADLDEAAANYAFDYDFLQSKDYGDPRRLEGYLFPDTYDFYENEGAVSVISRLLKNFNSKFDDTLRSAVESSGMTVDEIITIASMIEKEAGNSDERYAISSVIYNRLDAGMMLQIDATVVYALGDLYTGELTVSDLQYDSPYNTRIKYGLPPGAICSPGLPSIKAAIYPNDTNYYYYALGTDGFHRFFEDGDAFNSFVSSEEYGG